MTKDEVEWVPRTRLGKMVKEGKIKSISEVLGTRMPIRVSVDYAIMEKAPHVAMIPMPVDWLDVGNWNSFGATLPPDENANRAGGCTLAALNSRNVLAVSEEPHLIGVLGLDGVTVIHTPQATLVCRSDQAESIKQLVGWVEKNVKGDYV